MKSNHLQCILAQTAGASILRIFKGIAWVGVAKNPPCVRVDVASIEPRTLGQRRGCELARYGQSFKNRAVARLLPPERASLEEVAREVGVGGWTLERGRNEALSRPARERAWTAAARLEAVVTTAALDEAG